MIVISGALVLVALVLLVIGLIDPNLAFVYASIGASIAAGVFLLVGVLQRRGEDTDDTVTAGDTAGESAGEAAAPAGGDGLTSEGITTLPVARPVAAATDGAEGGAGRVLVVAGRPRYHVEGCRYLTGKSPESVEAGDARDEGFTACGVCKPDEALAAVATETEEPAANEPAVALEVAEPESSDTSEDEGSAPSRTRTATTRTPASRKAPTKTAPVKAPAKAAKAAATAPVKAPVKAAKAARVTSATKASAKSAASKAAAAPAKRGSVIVIPDRGRFHTPDCRYVRGAEDTLELSKAAATKQGYAPCGVCNP